MHAILLDGEISRKGTVVCIEHDYFSTFSIRAVANILRYVN